jgi:hypothetical protein
MYVWDRYARKLALHKHVAIGSTIPFAHQSSQLPLALMCAAQKEKSSSPYQYASSFPAMQAESRMARMATRTKGKDASNISTMHPTNMPFQID